MNTSTAAVAVKADLGIIQHTQYSRQGRKE